MIPARVRTRARPSGSVAGGRRAGDEDEEISPMYSRAAMDWVMVTLWPLAWSMMRDGTVEEGFMVL